MYEAYSHSQRYKLPFEKRDINSKKEDSLVHTSTPRSHPFTEIQAAAY